MASETPAPDNPDGAAPALSHKSKGCLYWGCLIGGILLLLAIVFIVFFVAQVRKTADAFTQDEPQTIETVETTPRETQRMQNLFNTFRQAAQQGAQRSFEFTERDLNAMVAAVPDLSDLKGNVHFTIQNGKLTARTSIPVDELPPLKKLGMSGGYFNGDITLDIQCENGILEVYADTITVGGNTLPGPVASRLREQNLAAQLYQQPEVLKALRHIETIDIRDDRLLIKTRTTSGQ